MQKNNVKKRRWVLPVVIVGVVLIFVILFVTLMVMFVNYASNLNSNTYGSSSRSSFFGNGNIVTIKIEGPITTEADSVGVFGGTGASSDWIVEQIKRAEEDNNVDGIIFEINSPGGTVVASKEIVDAIKATKKPTASYIREVGASGAYWAASATDHIVADELSITGSIGVIGSYLSFGGLLENYNVTYERFVSGHLKDAGSPYRSLSDEERRIIQGKIDIMYDYFVDDVSKSRGIPRDEMEKIATGMYYLGTEALDLNLIDGFGGEEEAKDYIAIALGLDSGDQITVEEYQRQFGFFDSFYGASASISHSIGEGIASGLSQSKGLEIRA